MENFNSYNQESLLQPMPVASKNFMANVFLWMFAALALSALTSFIVSHNVSMLSYFYNADGRQNIIGKAVMFMPLAFVLLMSFAYNRLSLFALGTLFVLYSIINGISFSYIFLLYTSSSIMACFASAAAMFGIMAVAGYTTKQDLTKMGSLLMMALVGLIIMSIINWFMNSDTMGYVLSAISVIIFTGLTAYDMQKLKNISYGMDQQGNALAIENTNKLAIMGALNLYLDFINIFLALLRLFGKRN